MIFLHALPYITLKIMTKVVNPCIMLINDVHVSKDNIPEFTANWNEALSICESRGVREIALGGDLFSSRVSQTLDVLLAVHDALMRCSAMGIHITLANGNHCKVNQEAIRGYCHVFDTMPGVTVVDDFLSLDDPAWDFTLHMIAYFPEEGSFREKLGCLVAGGLEKTKYNYLYIHEGINGALAQPSSGELPAGIFTEFDKVFVAHYHNRAKIKGTDIEYIGSSRQFNFGEDEEKGYTLLYTDGSCEFIKNKANVRYKVIEVPVEKVNTHLTDQLSEIRELGRYKVKVRVAGTTAAAASVDKAALMEAGASKVEIVTKDPEMSDIVSSSLFERFDSQKIRESYEQFCSYKDIADPALGLSYLSKIEAPCGN